MEYFLVGLSVCLCVCVCLCAFFAEAVGHLLVARPRRVEQNRPEITIKIKSAEQKWNESMLIVAKRCLEQKRIRLARSLPLLLVLP